MRGLQSTCIRFWVSEASSVAIQCMGTVVEEERVGDYFLNGFIDGFTSVLEKDDSQRPYG